MKKTAFTFLVIVFPFLSTCAQKSCLQETALKTLDAQYEKALLESDAQFLENLLAKDFIWVHNHNSMTDTKEALVKRAKNTNATGNTRARTQSDVQVIILGATAVVTGITVVDRGPKPTTYHFMRTYVEIEGECKLLANHTMAVPEEEE